MLDPDESVLDPNASPEASLSESMNRIFQTRWKIALVVTGGGSGAIAKCFRRSGASRNFVEAVIPYSHAALADYLNGPPVAGHADLSTATQIASVAFDRAVKVGGGDPKDAVGIALVAALPTDPPRDHIHRIHVALHADSLRQTWSCELTDRTYTRQQAEDIADAMVLAAIEFLTE